VLLKDAERTRLHSISKLYYYSSCYRKYLTPHIYYIYYDYTTIFNNFVQFLTCIQ